MAIELSTAPQPAEVGSNPKIDRAAYLAGLLNLRPSLDGSSVSPAVIALLTDIRDRAAARVQELALPSTKDEEWRFTDLTPLLQTQFTKLDVNAVCVSNPLRIAPEAAAQYLQVVNGHISPLPDGVVIHDLPSGLWVGSLAVALSRTDLATKLQAHLAQMAGGEEVFTALNTASFTDVALIWVPKNLIAETPVHIVFTSTAAQHPHLIHPRCLVIAEAGSRLTFLEEYESSGSGQVLTNAVTEIWLQDNAQVSHTRIQREHLGAFHIGKTAVSQARDSRYICNAISLGAQLSRHHLEVYQAGEQTETTLNGLTVIAGEQVADTHSLLSHAYPYGTSQQLHKCIVSDRAHAIFNGKVSVPQAAQLTNASQLSRNLLLSPRARVDTKPQLEIVADNVKCAHGATVSQLENDEIFYLQSRGLDRDSASRLLVNAFAMDILNRIPIASVRSQLTEQLTHSS
jgi:Fe-S cluster assembly protein SufD